LAIHEHLAEGTAARTARGMPGVSPAADFRLLQFPAYRQRLERTEPDAIRTSHVRAVSKRGLDLCLSVAALILLVPVLVAIALFVRFESEGPALFRQQRLGLNGEPFRILKFRTMHVLEDGDEIRQAEPNDRRVTRVGRFLRSSSLDELPQLINVLKGEMSLVGPRPHAVVHDRQFGALIANYALRHRVKPGITGWAQVNGFRGATPAVHMMRHRIDHDVWYARNASFLLDLKILLLTPRELLRQRNAC
jgi:putative colanic acid biosynthesis UDP-glucose lipid carrier transferase